MKILKMLLLFTLISCTVQQEKMVPLFELPSNLKETSGISYSVENKLIWTLEDSGNENKIYALTNTGKIARTLTINETKNTDWEDITSDLNGNIYIGDFGNNDNERMDLSIYRIEKSSLQNSATVPTYITSFYYPEQTEFPPKKKALFYDCEAFFEYKNNFYLFTKNRSKDFDGTTFIYKIPNQAGRFKAELISKFITCDQFNNCAITSAAISPDEKKIVLLSHGKVWLFENFSNDAFIKGTISELELEHYSQKEAICFKDNNTLLIADEKAKKRGGYLYECKISQLKSKP